MALDANDVDKYLKLLFGQHEDSYQEAWVKILEHHAQTIHEIEPIAKKVRNRAVRQYLHRKYREVSLHRPLGKSGDCTFTLESILPASSTSENVDAKDSDENDNAKLYGRIVEFLIEEYLRQKNENLGLKKRELELKAERIGLRREWFKFKRDRFESWKKLMEDKGKQKEDLLRLHVQLQREKLKFRKQRLVARRK
ncbi:MAG: hypothetical protein ABSD38_31785 [Syntrophorhabdales bacterium]|jgi:hypothetical protein